MEAAQKAELAAEIVADKAADVDLAAGMDSAALNDTQILFLMNVSADDYENNDCLMQVENDELSLTESGLSDEELVEF